jgi:hypothetical protein
MMDMPRVETRRVVAAAERASFQRWRWRNCRDIGFSIGFWPLSWAVGFQRGGDAYGVRYDLLLGPFNIAVDANIGRHAVEAALTSHETKEG